MASIRIATREEIESFYGPITEPVRMAAIEKDGAVVGVAGLVWSDHGVQAISWLRKEAKSSPKAILRCAHIVQAMAEEVGGVVYAAPDPDEPSANGLLQHIGFKPQAGGWYEYRAEPR